MRYLFVSRSKSAGVETNRDFSGGNSFDNDDPSDPPDGLDGDYGPVSGAGEPEKDDEIDLSAAQLGAKLHEELLVLSKASQQDDTFANKLRSLAARILAGLTREQAHIDQQEQKLAAIQTQLRAQPSDTADSHRGLTELENRKAELVAGNRILEENCNILLAQRRAKLVNEVRAAETQLVAGAGHKTTSATDSKAESIVVAARATDVKEDKGKETPANKQRAHGTASETTSRPVFMNDTKRSTQRRSGTTSTTTPARSKVTTRASA
jgi:hypothetical protein